MSKLYPYVVLLTEELAKEDPPIPFQCSAENSDHAEEQAEDAYPGCTVEFTMCTSSVRSAYQAYEGEGPDGT